jgi:hypothetical protein
MFIVLSWLFVVVLLATWSLGVWMTHSALVWSINGVGVIASQPRQVQTLEIPDLIALWVPPELLATIQAGANAALPMMDSAFAFLPSIAGWLTPLSWGVWGIGTLALIAIGAVLHFIIFSMLRVAKQ